MNDHERQLVAKLKDDPAWGALQAAVRDKKQKVFANLAGRLMASGRRVDPDDIVREVVLATGFFQGMEFLLREPSISVKAIERELAEVETNG